MADRYKIIAEQEYTDIFFGGMPVALIKSRMLFDNDTQKVVTQIKLMSITDSVIDTVYLSLKFYDVAGALIAEINEHIMSMLDIQENKTFGEKFPVYITDTRAARVDVSVNKVVFKSGNVWENSDDKRGVKVSPAAPVDIKPNLKEQFLKSTSGFNVRANCRYEEFDNCKRCSCGFLNEKEAVICRNCGAEFDNIRKCFSDEYLIARIYADAKQKMSNANVGSLKSAVTLFEKISDCSDVTSCINECRETIARLEAAEAERKRLEAEKKEADRKAREAREAAIAEENRRKKKRNTIIAVVSSLTVVCVATAIVLFSYVFPLMDYNAAMNLYNAGRYDEAVAAFERGSYGKSAEMVLESKYSSGVLLYNNKEYEKAYEVFSSINYKNSNEMLDKIQLEKAVILAEAGKIDEAVAIMTNNYKGKLDEGFVAIYDKLLKENKFAEAVAILDNVSDINTVKSQVYKINLEYAITLQRNNNYEEALSILDEMKDNEEARNKADDIRIEFVEELFNNKKYNEALTNLKKVNNRKEINKICYEYGEKLFSIEDYENAKIFFSHLVDRGEDAEYGRKSVNKLYLCNQRLKTSG